MEKIANIIENDSADGRTVEERNKRVFRIGDRVALSGGRTGTIVQLSGKKVKLTIAGESARWIDKLKI